MLRDRLVRDIERSGPLPFERFMEACLYDPDGGFFVAGPLRSEAAGDFLTSPEVSPWFGRTIARWASAVRGEVGDPFTVVEVGAGSGSLLTALRPELAPGDVECWAVDASPAARRRLADVVGGERVVERIEDVPFPIRGVVIANELLDNLPVSLVVRTESGWEERWVGAVDGALCLVAAPVRPEVEAWADAFGGSVPVDGMVEVQLAAGSWLKRALAAAEAGALLAVDYGGTVEELEPRRTRGTLRTYRAHHLGPDPLTAPGETDVTVDVNFSALKAVAESGGHRLRLERQDDFLSRWGLRDVVSELRQAELTAARAGDTMRRLRLRSERTDAETLLHPRGLGDFRVLTVSVPPRVREDGGTRHAE